MGKPNKRRTDLERARQIILSVASELFMTRGSKNTSARETVLRAGVTQPNLYHRFESKKELYLVMIKELTSCVREELVSIVSRNASVEEKLYRLIKILLDEHPTSLFLMSNNTFQEMGPDYNCMLYQVSKRTYISNITTTFENKLGANCLQEGISADDTTRFILYSVNALLNTERTYQQKTVDDDAKKSTRFMLHDVLKSYR